MYYLLSCKSIYSKLFDRFQFLTDVWDKLSLSDMRLSELAGKPEVHNALTQDDLDVGAMKVAK